jgi:hypothetical protein
MKNGLIYGYFLGIYENYDLNTDEILRIPLFERMVCNNTKPNMDTGLLQAIIYI